MLKALWNATIVFTTKIYRNYVYFNTTCVNHVANYNFRFLLVSFGIPAWLCMSMVVYVHVCIIIQTELQTVTDLSAATFKGFTFVFLPKLQVGPGRPAVHLTLYNLAFQSLPKLHVLIHINLCFFAFCHSASRPLSLC